MGLPPATAAFSLAPGGVRHRDEPPAADAWPSSPAWEESAAILPQGAADAPYVLTYGTIEATFPSLSVEKEFYQAIDPDAEGRELFAGDDTLDLWRVNKAARSGNLVYTVLSKPENLYIAREMCWTLRIGGGAGGYRLLPDEEEMLQLLIAALAPGADGRRLTQRITGERAPALPSPCDAEGLPPLHPLRLEPISAELLVKQLAKQAPTADGGRLTALVQEGLTLAANPGDSDERRAMNQQLLTAPGLYLHAYEQRYNGKAPNPDGFELSAVTPTPAGGDSPRRVIQVRLDYEGLNTGVTRRWGVPVDVTGAYPFATGEIKRLIGAN